MSRADTYYDDDHLFAEKYGLLDIHKKKDVDSQTGYSESPSIRYLEPLSNGCRVDSQLRIYKILRNTYRPGNLESYDTERDWLPGVRIPL